MLIPAIDLMGGRVVQLRHGEELLFATDDLQSWLDRFDRFPLIQVIDLDAARGRGDNGTIVRELCRARPCQVGGGIRTPADAEALLASGASRVIVGSALFDDAGVDLAQAGRFAAAIGGQALIAALDSRRGRVVINGWKTQTSMTAIEAARLLDPVAGGFLYTHVDTEGTLSGLDPAPVIALQAATSRRIIAAGGIRTLQEVDELDRLGIDAVVGMAIYSNPKFFADT